jgi:hypothetical protein
VHGVPSVVSAQRGAGRLLLSRFCMGWALLLAWQVLGNPRRGYWRMANGYLLPAKREAGQLGAMAGIRTRLAQEQGLADAAEAALRVGVHWDTATATPRRPRNHQAPPTADGAAAQAVGPHRVCQVFCSALPVAYAKSTRSVDW